MLNRDFPKDLRSLLFEDEKIIWFSRAELKPLVLRRLPGIMLPLVFILVPFMIVPFNVLMSSSPQLFLVLFLAFWLGISGLMIFSSSLYPILLWRNLCYVLTDRRIIVRRGVIGIDYDILNLEQVQQINIDRGIWDRIYGTGSIIIQAIGVSPIRISSIREPFNVQELIAKAIKARKI